MRPKFFPHVPKEETRKREKCESVPKEKARVVKRFTGLVKKRVRVRERNGGEKRKREREEVAETMAKRGRPQEDGHDSQPASLLHLIGANLRKVACGSSGVPATIISPVLPGKSLLVSRVNARLAEYKLLSSLRETERILRRLADFRDTTRAVCPPQDLLLLWLESLEGILPATRLAYGKTATAAFRRWMPGVEIPRVELYLKALVLQGATQPTSQAPPLQYDELSAMLEGLLPRHAAMAAMQLLLGCRSVDTLRMYDLSVTTNTTEKLEGTIWLAQEKNNNVGEKRKKSWSAVTVLRKALAGWLVGRTFVDGPLFHTRRENRVEDERQRGLEYDEFLFDIKRQVGGEVFSTHSFKRTHHRRVATARPDLPDDELRLLTGHASAESMNAYLGPDVKERRSHRRMTSAQLDAQEVRETI